MLLAIDIGNSNTVFGILRGKKVISKLPFASSRIDRRDFAHEVRTGFKKKRIKLEEIDGIIISSVAPQYTPKLTRCLKRIFKLKPMYAGPCLKLGIRLGYRNPGHLGQDRLANAVAAYKIYGGPVIIVDYGTAITVCLVNQHGYYKGGIILPGIEMIASALAQKTALLPHIRSLQKPRQLIGQDTKESIASGLAYGLSEMVDGLIRRIKKEVRTRVKVISTGGAAKFFFKYSEEIDKIDTGLTLKGLYIIYNMNKESKK